MEHQDKFEASLSAEGRYRMLVEAVTDYAIYMLDPNGIVTSWNPGTRRFKFANSWGTAWADKGFAYFSRDDADMVLNDSLGLWSVEMESLSR